VLALLIVNKFKVWTVAWREASVGRELRGTRWSRGPPALNCDAPSMGIR